MITNHGKGNAQLTNLPRKINLCVSPTRDDFPHTQINDVGFEAVRDPATGEVRVIGSTGVHCFPAQVQLLWPAAFLAPIASIVAHIHTSACACSFSQLPLIQPDLI